MGSKTMSYANHVLKTMNIDLTPPLFHDQNWLKFPQSQGIWEFRMLPLSPRSTSRLYRLNFKLRVGMLIRVLNSYSHLHISKKKCQLHLNVCIWNLPPFYVITVGATISLNLREPHKHYVSMFDMTPSPLDITRPPPKTHSISLRNFIKYFSWILHVSTLDILKNFLGIWKDKCLRN
jgi:hypothetical protein